MFIAMIATNISTCGWIICLLSSDPPVDSAIWHNYRRMDTKVRQ